MADLDSRLDRIEGKLDRLIKLEQKQVSNEEAQARFWTRLERNEANIQSIQVSLSAINQKINGNSRFVNILIGVMASIFSTVIASGLVFYLVR